MPWSSQFLKAGFAGGVVSRWGPSAGTFSDVLFCPLRPQGGERGWWAVQATTPCSMAVEAAA